MHLTLDEAARGALWERVVAELEAYWRALPGLPVAPRATRDEMRAALAGYDFAAPRDPADVVSATAALLRAHLLHTAHPAYFGVFNPAPSTMGVAADALVAGFNPQLASSASAGIAIEMENHLIRWFGAHFGWPDAHGSFASGGTAANHTALLCALAVQVPGFARDGLGGARPVIYASDEAHQSFERAARLCGLGTAAVARIAGTPEVTARIAADRAAGKTPLMLVATLGTTSAGAFEDIAGLSEVAAREDLWLHADAAWGGAAILLPEHRALFAGVERADSLTLDAHKWLSVPMGAGMFFTRHPRVQEDTFRVDQTPYMPGHTYDSRDTEPYKQSLEWSRRFTGLKLWMTLAVHGIEGYRAVLRHQIAMGAALRERLTRSGWRVMNDTPLPVVCFVDPARPAMDVEDFARKVGRTGRTWITPTRLADTPVLRAGIASYHTGEGDLDALVAVLDAVRAD